MKILLIIDDYLPESIKVGAKMMHELAVEFLKQGHEVTVITPSSKLIEKTKISTLDGITVCQFRSGEIKNIGKFKRAVNESLLSYKAWNCFKLYFKNNPQDLIVYYSPSIFWGGLVLRLKKLWNIPSYLILRDIFPQCAIDQGLIKKNSFIGKYFQYFEKLNYAAADSIGLMSLKSVEWFNKTNNFNKQLGILFNWASNTPVESNGLFRKTLGLDDKVVFFYGGNIGHSQDMMNIVRLAIKMRDEILAHFVLVGAGDEVELVKKAIEQEQLTNVTLLPSVSQNDFKLMLAEFDIGLFSLHRDHTTHNFPGKLLGYMVQELPILGSINKGNDLKHIVEDGEAGFITINGEDNKFYGNALKLLHDAVCRKKMGENARILFENRFSVVDATQTILGNN